MSGCLSANQQIDDGGIEPGTILLGWDQSVSRTIGSPQLMTYQGCEELEHALKVSIEEETRTNLIQAVEEIYYWGGGWMEDDVAMMDGAEGAPSADSNQGGTTRVREEGVDYSGTNNQEQGVDEADFVKTDGYHIFFLDSGVLHILNVPEFGQLELASTTEIEGSPVAMMLNGDRLVVISTVSSWNIDGEDPLAQAMGWGGEWGSWRTSTLTKFTVFDISDASDPLVDRELYIEGWYMTAREVDGTVRTVTHTWMDIPGLKTWLELPDGYWRLDYDDPLRRTLREEAASAAILHNQETLDSLSLADILPQVHERIGTEISTHHMSDDDCNDFAAPTESHNRGFTSIFTLDLVSDELAFEADHIVGNWPMVYASEDVLVITENAWDWWWFWGNDGLDEATNIHTFDIGEAGSTLYTGSGRVDGTINDQFSLSEYEGVVRVATTTGQWARWWMSDPEPMESHVVTFGHTVDIATGEQQLTEIGRVDGIAQNETIWSARFVEDRAYLVTFRNMDPLWTIDLSDVTNPRVMGELEVPGVSTYIHPLSSDAILTIGLGPADEETGTGLDWSHTRLSLFDVSNFSNPQAGAILSLTPVNDPDEGWTWAWSEATYEHKAFQFWAPKGMLAVPVNTYRYDYWYDANDEYHWNYEWISKLMIINVTEDDLTLHGEINHSDFYDDGHHWWSSTNIRRSIFMGDYIYAISHGGITATNLTTMEETARVDLVDEIVYEDENSSNSEGDRDDGKTSEEDRN
ncbi:MAG: beta-propeller domain-containing protein [Candidatus Poseidoniaceae archaeon]|nr:beta-propeller domain-containing protein [Candidatus Poseidoniaceae archaeon]